MDVREAREEAWKAEAVWYAALKLQSERRCEYRTAKESCDRIWHSLQDINYEEQEARELLAEARGTLDNLHNIA